MTAPIVVLVLYLALIGFAAWCLNTAGDERELWPDLSGERDEPLDWPGR